MIIISAGGPRAISCPGSFIIIIIRIILTHLKGWVEEQIKKVVNKKETKGTLLHFDDFFSNYLTELKGWVRELIKKVANKKVIKGT